MPSGFSLGSNLRVPKMFGGNGISNAAAPRRNCSKGLLLQTGKCEWDLAGTQRQRRASELKEVERIKQLLVKLEVQEHNNSSSNNNNTLSRSSQQKNHAKSKDHDLLPIPSLDESSEGLEARMRAEFVMIKDRLRKMERDLHQLGTTR